MVQLPTTPQADVLQAGILCHHLLLQNKKEQQHQQVEQLVQDAQEEVTCQGQGKTSSWAKQSAWPLQSPDVLNAGQQCMGGGAAACRVCHPNDTGNAAEAAPSAAAGALAP